MATAVSGPPSKQGDKSMVALTSVLAVGLVLLFVILMVFALAR